MAPLSSSISVPLIRISLFLKDKKEHDRGDSNSKLSVMEYTSSEVN